MLEFIISVMCTQGTIESPKYTEACRKGLEASSIELSIKDKVHVLERKVENRVIEETGRNIWITAGVIHHFVQTNEMLYIIPGKPISDSMSIKANSRFDVIELSLSWSL